MSIAAPIVRALVEVVERDGVPRQDFLRRAGVTAERFADGLGRFTLDEFESIQRLALDVTGDEALGLHLAEGASEAAFDVLGHLVAHAPTLREALGLCSQFSSLLVDDAHLLLEEHVDVARLRHDFRRTSLRADRMHAEFAIAGFCRLIRIFAGPGVKIDAARFEHSAPAHRSEYRRVFGGAEKFGQKFTGVEFSRALLDAPQLHQHPRLYSLLHAEAHRTLDALGHGTGHGDRVKRYLMARPASRIPKMDVAARELGMSARSLRRHLAAEGVSYRELVQSMLEEAASHLLRTPGRSVQEVARATGFSDSAAFHRAFKQWTGVTPATFQRRSPAAHAGAKGC
ncbi:MAG TPA: AraC family transcriptional regulator [Polyangiaceae bacterium]|jgi:AraC-like DNA-binding protein|nr:AraC family transcriptional regulator [Polyangiaceae bacterium]